MTCGCAWTSEGIVSSLRHSIHFAMGGESGLDDRWVVVLLCGLFRVCVSDHPCFLYSPNAGYDLTAWSLEGHDAEMGQWVDLSVRFNSVPFFERSARTHRSDLHRGFACAGFFLC